MENSTKILIGGVALAAFILVLGRGNSYRIATGLRDLQAACAEEGKRNFNPFKAELICEPGDLVSLPITSEPLGGIQAQIAASQRAFRFREPAGFPQRLQFSFSLACRGHGIFSSAESGSFVMLSLGSRNNA